MMAKQQNQDEESQGRSILQNTPFASTVASMDDGSGSDKDQEDQDKNFLKRKLLDIDKAVKNEFKIPHLLADREEKMKKEYDEREGVKIDEMGITAKQFKQLKEMDMLYGGETTEEEIDKLKEEEEEAMMDPYMKKKEKLLKPQKYRTVTIGKEDILKNGQMVKIEIADAFDEEKFHPTDQVLLLKFENKYYALGSFCGYCYSELSDGAFLGEKLACAECGSNYDITTGFVETGPNLRNLSNFPIRVRKGQLELTVPEHIPPFSKKKFVKREQIDPRTIVILGDDETVLSIIDGLRVGFTGRIVVIPYRTYG